MGFPRKNDAARIYRERSGKDLGSYLVIFIEEDRRQTQWDAIANVYPGNDPSLVSTTVTTEYFNSYWPTRVQWDEVPAEWQSAIRKWLNVKPESIKGFWRVGEQPTL